MSRSRSILGFAWAEPPSILPSRARSNELQALVRRCVDEGIQIRLLGGGSNVLVRDEGVPGMVVSLPEQAFGAIATNGRKITAGAGGKLGHLISVAVREGLAGLEPLVGIPGSVGGALTRQCWQPRWRHRPMDLPGDGDDAERRDTPTRTGTT